MNEEIVFSGTSKKGTKFIIRYPKMNDLDQLWKYINTLSAERSFIRFQGEEIPYQEEEKYLAEQIKKIQEQKAIVLYVIVNDQLIGISDINMFDRIESHIGIFGITIAQEFRNEGIGSILMNILFAEAEKKLPQLKIIKLGVFANNPQAINMYKKAGFTEYGNLPEGILYKEKYIDHLYMYKKIR